MLTAASCSDEARADVATTVGAEVAIYVNSAAVGRHNTTQVDNTHTCRRGGVDAELANPGKWVKNDHRHV